MLSYTRVQRLHVHGLRGSLSDHGRYQIDFEIAHAVVDDEKMPSPAKQSRTIEYVFRIDIVAILSRRFSLRCRFFLISPKYLQ